MPEDTKIVRAAIHPGIGIARVGNSEEGYYIGPEVTDPDLMNVNNRDENGAIKRQAAKFRIYGYNAAGEVVKEIKGTDANTTISWTAHLANRKAQWYKFVVALDLPEAPDILDSLKIPQSPYQPSEHRNPSLRGEDREQLAIDPGHRTIAGQSGEAPQRFDNGTFLTGVNETTVYLGELRTDEHGRLLVLGGFGNSASPTKDTIYNGNDPSGFVNPDNWYDDISDGPVTATVTIDTESIPVESSWVVVAPPNYAPGIIGWRTLYDLLVDTYVECGWMPMPTTASFTKDILPVLSRLSNLQWVNKGFATLFGKGCPMDFSDPELLNKLADKEQEDRYHELRQIAFNIFRPAETESNTGSSWPWIYGDGFGSAPESSPSNNLALSKVRMELMRLWVEGNFENDYSPEFIPPSCLDEVNLQEQPAMLDKAALHFCLADAFHPGCELTWPMRHSTLYSAQFRVRHAEDTANTQQDYGSVLTPEIVLRPGGPLYAQGAGDLTRWMGIPWQADTGFCRSGYDSEYDPYLPTFWPANVPNHVLTEENYQIIIGEGTDEDKLKAFYTRDFWWRAFLSYSTIEAMEYVVDHFAELGIIELREWNSDIDDIPSEIFVESLLDGMAEKLRDRLADSEQARLALPSRIRRAGWASVEQLEAFRRVRLNR
ncbi:MAG: LodA/GoxA family CTQ-dependent oxidase [Calothrix sp. MO_167.B42]|nr:LodA/GoxA family CTQ-dependent oxidase [Calothrix sp. MO_167.B42]